MKKLALLILFISAFYIFGNEMDDMFFGEEIVTEVTESDMSEDMDKNFLISEDTEIGGKISFEVKSEIVPGESEVTTPSLGGSIYLDARPDEDFRAFIKGDIEVPFNDEDDADFTLKEIFSDFNYKDSVYFRAGKYKINWGVGRYFSPVDVLNITEIDPDDPDNEREGPVSLKTNIPMGLNNFNFYMIVPEDYNSVSDTTFALNYSFLLMDTEITIGGIYSEQDAPKGAFTFTGGLWDFQWYSEVLLAYGSDLSALNEEDEQLYFSGTVGGSYTLSIDDVATNFGFNGQYYFNGELEQHHIIGSASILDIFDSGVNLTLTSQNELKENTGKIKGVLSYNLLELFSLSAGVNYNYNEEQPISLEFIVALGGGSF